jgi:FkbM family methyltransferase
MKKFQIKSLVSFLVMIQNYLVVSFLRVLFLKKTTTKLTRLGSFYGGWWVPEKVLDDEKLSRVLISVGLGHDVTLDKALLEHGFMVVGLDPLSNCVELAKKELSNFPNFQAIHAGLWTHDGVENFFAPRAQVSDAWSISNVQGTPSQSKEIFPVISLKTLKSQLPYIKKADFRFLKMDIEGAELPLLTSLRSEIPDIDFLGVELDFLSLLPLISISRRFMAIREAVTLFRNMESQGLILIHTENFNFFWNRK